MRYKSPEAVLAFTDEEHVSAWMTISQDRVNSFANATEDRQWIHLDAERAASGPFGSTISHGFLTLSLIPHLVEGALEVEGVAMRMNAGLDRVRFTSPVLTGNRIRARTKVTHAQPATAGVRVTLNITIEIEGSARPALVADQLVLLIPEQP